MTISRRDIIKVLTELSVPLLLQTPSSRGSALIAQKFLSQCAVAITACWSCLKGNDFATVIQILSPSLPHLVALAQQPSRNQRFAAHLASQSYLQASLVVRHKTHNFSLSPGIWYDQQAVTYSELTEDRNLQVAALKQLADTYYYNHRYVNMCEAYGKAVHLINIAHSSNEVLPLLRGRIYAGLADAYVKCAQLEKAEQYLNLLRNQLSLSHLNDQLPLYADCGIHSLYLWEGLTLLDLGAYTNHQNSFYQANKVLAQVEQFPTTLVIPERTRIEIIMHQAEIAIKSRNMEEFCMYIKKGAGGLKVLESRKRHRELIDVYNQALMLWPQEMKVKEIANFL